MNKPKQTIEHRQRRLSEGRCPIHGISMPQVGLEQVLLPCGHYESGRYIAGCPRKDCEIKAYFIDPDGEGELLPEFKYVLE